MSHQIVAGISNRSMYNALWKKWKPTHIICYGRLHREGGIALDLVQDFESQGGIPEERHGRNESQDDWKWTTFLRNHLKVWFPHWQVLYGPVKTYRETCSPFIQSSITHSFNILSVGEREWYGKKVLGSSPSSITNSPSDLEQISGPQFPYISTRKSRFMISEISSCICDNCRVRIGQEVSKCHWLPSFEVRRKITFVNFCLVLDIDPSNYPVKEVLSPHFTEEKTGAQTVWITSLYSPSK